MVNSATGNRAATAPFRGSRFAKEGRSDLLGRLSGYNQSVGKATATGLCHGGIHYARQSLLLTYIILENFVVSHNPAYGLNSG